jgi:hypothetical protein
MYVELHPLTLLALKAGPRGPHLGHSKGNILFFLNYFNNNKNPNKEYINHLIFRSWNYTMHGRRENNMFK